MSLSVGVNNKTLCSGSSSMTSSSLTIASGSGIIIGLIYDNPSPNFSSISDSRSSANITLIGAGETTFGTNAGRGRWYYLPTVTSGSGYQVTVNFSGAMFCTLFVAEVTTTNGSGITIDQNNVGNDATSPFTSPSITTTIANEILWGLTGEDGASGTYNHTAGNSFTLLLEETTGGTNWCSSLQYRVVSSTGSYNTSTTVSPGSPTDTADWIASFSETASAQSSLTWVGYIG